MPQQWTDQDTFHLGINMAGAVSAGAYTAGVLDFLTEALEEWYKAKAAPNPAVPMHNLSIDVFSGASAGGMCAAISAAMLQGAFEHIHDPQDATIQGTTNKFYESWVNKIDIEWLLQTDDLVAGKPVTSLLDSTIIDQIADYAIAPGVPAPRPYVSKALTLFLTVTNVRGIPYSLNGDAPGSAEEDIRYYADRLQFETVATPDALPLFPLAKRLPLGSNADAWPLLKETAKATGAFPLFLAPRLLQRDVADFLNSPWEPIADPLPQPTPAHWPLKAGDTFTTLNVDGGVTNNDPFQLAHDYLAVHNPSAARDHETGELKNPPEQNKANCAVLTIAPFPATDLYDADYPFAKNSSVFGMLPNLFTALIAQSRFLGESLNAVIDTAAYSRFVLAPSDASHPRQPALQCGLLSAFGGFFERGFRAHDYQLGRRNCQRFLQETFRLTIDNPVIAAGLAKLDNPDTVIGDFAGDQPGTLPIIPLCGSAAAEVHAPIRATISSTRVDQIVDWATGRLRAVAKHLIDDSIKPAFQNQAAKAAAETLISTIGKTKLREALTKNLAGVIAN
jgi:predicted acylesterase/phospholipase RssA